MIYPSSLWKTQKMATTVNNISVAFPVPVPVPVPVVEVTIYFSSLWKTQKKNPS